LKNLQGEERGVFSFKILEEKDVGIVE